MAEEQTSSSVGQVVGQIPCGCFILTTAFDGRRSGLLARWVQRCSIDPPMVMVAIPKGQPVEPIILDSRCFALCQIRSDDRYLLRKFTNAPDRSEDPFVAISTANAPSGSPLIDRAISFMDCEVIRHIELESDHRVYVGQIHAARVLCANDDNGSEARMNGRAAS